jgi:hypothetical protein
VLFETISFSSQVSQSPNLKVILETMWEKIVRRKKSEFQNVEDAHRQLQQHMLRQAKPTLVVLDDVWSRANLEKLLFEGEGYKTLVTTRDRSTIPTTTSTRFMNCHCWMMLMLCPFSAFGLLDRDQFQVLQMNI